MKIIPKFILSAFLSITVNYSYSISTGDMNKPTPKNNDSITTKNNIVIFKMIPTPANTTNGSLKKAGKVARTSNSRS